MKNAVFALMAAGLMAGAVPQLAWADLIPPAQAKLATPVAQAKKVVIDGRIWRCEADTCKAGEQGTDQPAQRECGKLAKSVGEIAAYTSGTRTLPEDQLAACNAAAKK
jgi:hypothetical protein